MTDDPNDHAWPSIRAELRRAVAESAWHVWLEPLELISFDGATLVVVAPGSTRDWVADRYERLLTACARAVLGPDVTVNLTAADDVAVGGSDRTGSDGDGPASAGPRARMGRTGFDVRTGSGRGSGTGGGRAATGAPGRRSGPNASTGSESHGEGSGENDPRQAPALNPRFTFEQFVIGDSNRLAHAAALAVAEMPGLAYNPLYLCGRPGLGKTHLLHSIGNYVREYGSGLTVRYTTAEAFTNHFLAAIHGTGIDRFKAAYRGVDVLLVDDVQFLQSKARTEQEFFHTFNALHAGGAQIVLTSDRMPRDLGELEDRLRERFEAGLVCDIHPPDHATRLTVLRKRAVQDGLRDVELGALERIADRVVTSVRALEGALIRVVAFGSLTGRTVTAELADEVLTGLYPDLRPRARTVREIQEQTCEEFGISLDELLSARRSAQLAWARQVAMYLARELTDHSLPAIGSAFGGRTHTTVLHACKRTAERITADADAFATVQRLTRQLGGGR